MSEHGPFQRIVKFAPAYDKRHSDPKKNFGIHGVELRFVLKGPEGAVQFLLYTNWMLPHVHEELVLRNEPWMWRPTPADLGYHSPRPRFTNHEPIAEKCEYLDGKPCYYDGSSLAAERIYLVLLKEGDEGVWRELESHYREIFSEKVS